VVKSVERGPKDVDGTAIAVTRYQDAPLRAGRAATPSEAIRRLVELGLKKGK
jgi:hypothetical protein